ncbi:hypothetical protein HPP92_025877 [Vanilla planifolia]|uniref:Uncharacterized protein n=1 Tax=Vanilla planifolia TaxID=51239 RepID=A0A835PKS5_VANPL|nr:hypothetical protein HPP92_026161 [Vanilla planifolia]KAG0452066.1 hypothetical protein HPP92_025877 [Vanilla planifolia]
MICGGELLPRPASSEGDVETDGRRWGLRERLPASTMENGFSVRENGGQRRKCEERWQERQISLTEVSVYDGEQTTGLEMWITMSGEGVLAPVIIENSVPWSR